MCADVRRRLWPTSLYVNSFLSLWGVCTSVFVVFLSCFVFPRHSHQVLVDHPKLFKYLVFSSSVSHHLLCYVLSLICCSQSFVVFQWIYLKCFKFLPTMPGLLHIEPYTTSTWHSCCDFLVCWELRSHAYYMYCIPNLHVNLMQLCLISARTIRKCVSFYNRSTYV